MDQTLPSAFTIRDSFPPVSYDQWRALAEESLHGVPFEKKLVTPTHEGIDLQPVYSRTDTLGATNAHGFPGLAPFVRGSRPLGAALTGWDVRQEHAHPDLNVTQRAILADLNGGVTSIRLRLDAAARNGHDPDDDGAAELAGQDGLMAYTVDDLDAALAGVQLDLVGIALDAGAAAVPAAAALAALWKRRGISSDQTQGALNADPLAALARSGRLPLPTQTAFCDLAELAIWTAANYPHVTSVGVDTSPYHDAGATAVQDIAFGMATAVEYLRAMTAARLEIDRAAGQILFHFALGTHHFLAIAKLRAARRLWSRIIEASGGSAAAGAMSIHAQTSSRVLTRRDPYVNLLRNAVAMFAAGIGGATSLTSVPFDAKTGLPDDFSRRIARNTVHVLQEEGNLHRVVDPAGGSWFLDSLTVQLADKAWGVFQEIERQGGMLAALQKGWVAAQIDATYAARAKEIARRKEGITGVSEFPNVGEERRVQPPPDVAQLRRSALARLAAARSGSRGTTTLENINQARSSQTLFESLVNAAQAGATIGEMARGLGFHRESSARAAPLPLRSFAEPFEALRDASDAWLEAQGQRPRVFLANLGPVAHHTARATYAKNFFEAGGFEVIHNDGFANADEAAAAFAANSANIAVICSSDKLYPQLAPLAASKLKQAGARTVVLAGNPGENEAAWRAAGVDRFIFMKCDVLQTLRELLQESGVLEGVRERKT